MLKFPLAKQQLQDILSASLAKGGDWSELFLEHTSQNSILAEDNKIEKILSGTDQGAGIRIISSPHTYYASTNDLAYDNLLKIAKELASSIAQSKNDLSLNLKADNKISSNFIQFPEDIAIANKTKNVLRANVAARKIDPRIKQVTIGYRDTTQDVLIANSTGFIKEDKRIRTRFTTQIVAQKNAVLQTGYEGPGTLQGFEFFDKYKPEEIATEAAERALLMLEALPAPAGKMPVVLAGEAGGTLIHEACGHAFEGDFIYKKNLCLSR
ncbi:TldD/PmbA family protein [Candidatus Margulisiibacteriota bacterium]